ncbi:uncharacterized protein LOC124932652 [Impatiens glandulifera]|uniref:uncharacterized protein LOC124932652 n=1 Tax=Impatiens glandulifera TaxID=253017 RepID=UPI001FB11077|nr:uncharacterized protein LOC124932652 [Impatiens glandulifera]
MVSPSHLKFPHYFHAFSMKSSSSSSSSSTQLLISSIMKLKTLIQSLVFSHMRRAAKVLSKAKSILSQIFKDIHLIQIIEPLLIINKKNKVDTTKLFLGSFRMHYNWCSDSHSNITPDLPPTASASASAAMWNSLVWIEIDEEEEDGRNTFSTYPSWLKEKDDDDNDDGDIDKMAGAFIANCHEKFKLEKQESERKFQEMLARSV